MSILSTNQRLISLGQDYSAGENIGINDRVISSRNWTPDITYAAESAFQRANEYTNTQISALSGEVSSEVSQLGSEIDYISGVALTAHQSLEGYLTKASGDEYYQPIGSYATVSQLESTSGEIVNLIPTDYVNTETLEQTSGNIVNLIPDTSEFITNVSAEQTYQPIGNYLSSNALEGYATQDWVGEQGYITGVDLSNYYTKNETSGAEELENAFANIPLGDEEVNSLVHSNSGEWNNVSAKLDSTAFSTVSGDFLTAIPDEYATKDFVSNSISSKLDISSFSSVSGDFLTNEDLNGYATESFVENVSGDITALIPTNYYPDNNPSGFITGVDLTPYQTIEGMTAYQPVGDYVQGSDLSLNSYNKISAISGHELAGGGGSVDFDYDTDGNISGINSSAISDSRAGTPLYVESPLFTGQSGNSAYIGWNNETILYDNFTGRPSTVGGTITLSESPLNFDYVEIYLNGSSPSGYINIANGYEKVPNIQLANTHSLEFVKAFNANATTNLVGVIYEMGCGYSGVSSTTWAKTYGYAHKINTTAAEFSNNTHLQIWRIVGINRK